MPINEIFPRPTVKQVIFQIRYPNLFYIENRIGEFQMEVMEQFPESSLAFRQPIFITDFGPNIKIEDINQKLSSENIRKMWGFSSPRNYKLNVMSDSLDITSEYHKTYDNVESDNRFRDIIELVLSKFFQIMKVPIVSRVGLRYIDECPLPSKDTETYRAYFNTSFPLDKFRIEDAAEMDFKTVIKCGTHSLRFVESLQRIGDSFKVILDFDAFTLNVKSGDCLTITDELHALTIKQYGNTINKPILDYMRGK